jgi:hypothetical protein
MQIAIEFDEGQLGSYTDERIALLWHVAQANPVAHGDRQASELVEKLTWEIVRRWLGTVPPELYHHQGSAHFRKQLTRFAKYKPGGPSMTPEWHDGEWVLREDAPGREPEASEALEPQKQGDDRG